MPSPRYGRRYLHGTGTTRAQALARWRGLLLKSHTHVERRSPGRWVPTWWPPGRTWAPPLMQEFRRRVRQIVGGGVHSEVLQPFPSGLRKRMGEWTRRSGCGDWTVTATFTFAHIDEVLARDRLAIRVACQLRCPGRDEAHKFRGGLLHQKLGFRVDLRARTFGQFLPHYPVDAGQRQQKVLRDTDTGI